MNVLSRVVFGVSVLALGFACNKKEEKEKENSNSEVSAFGANANMNANVNLQVDPVAISKHIQERKAATPNKQAFATSLMETSFLALNSEAEKKKIRPYNVVVFNMANKYTFKPKEGYYFKSFPHEASGTTYGVFGFREGSFENRGNGGYDNWAMIGCHDHKEGDGPKLVNFTVCSGYQ